MKAFNILIAVFAISFLAIPALAESGSITVDTHQIFGDYILDVSGGASTTLSNFSVFKFYNTGYDTIVNMSWQSDGMTVPYESNVTHFTIVDGGSGEGYVSYSKALLRINWNFQPGAQITSNVFRVSYDVNIFNGFSLGAGGPTTQNVVPTASKPFCMVGGDGRCIRSNDNGAYPLHYGIDVSTDVTVNYFVDYPMAGKFRANITKPGTIETNVCINSSTVMYVCQSGFSLLPLNFFGNQLDGIYINVTHSGGDYNNVLVNATGSGVIIPTPAPTPTQNPLTKAGIVWNHNNYTINDIGIITYLIDSSILDFLYNFNIRISDSSGEVQRFDDLEVSTLTGTVQYQFPKTGTYTANFYKTLCVLGICTDSLLDTKTATVSFNPSYLYINSVVPAGVAFNATYIFGNPPALQGEGNSVVIEYLGTSGYEPFKTTSLNNMAISAGVSYNVSLIVSKPGQYRFSLFDVGRGILTTTTANAVSSFIPPQTNVTTSFIQTDKPTYFFNEVMLVNYAIDNNNYSNNSYEHYFTVKNLDNNLNTIDGIALYNQVDAFQLPLANEGNKADLCTVGITCYMPGRIRIWYPGNNQIQLNVRNATFSATIASADFVINQVNENGYGLDVSNTQPCEGQYVTVKTSTPATSGATVNIYLTKPGSDQFLYKTYVTNGSNRTNQVRVAWVGTYEIDLVSMSGEKQFTRYVTANNAGACAVTPTPTVPPIGGSQSASAVTSLLTSNIFWALIFIVGLMLAVAFKERK